MFICLDLALQLNSGAFMFLYLASAAQLNPNVWINPVTM